MSAAAAIATVNYLERENLAQHAHDIGQHVLDALARMQREQSLIGDVRGKGLMIGIELVKDRETKSPAPDEAKQVQEECRKAGLLVGCGGFYGNVIRFQPPLVITMAQTDRALEILDSAFSTVARPTAVLSVS